MRAFLTPVLVLPLILACGESVVPEPGSPDAGSGEARSDAGISVMDAGAPEETPDAGPPIPAPLNLLPGQAVELSGGRLEIGATFADVRGIFTLERAAGRSYTTPVADGTVTLWFANTNLDRDDDAPEDVDAGDRLLWVAVSEGFRGRTPEGLELGDARDALTAAYGTPHRSRANADGAVDSYLSRGLFATTGRDGTITTLTVSRTYPELPSADLRISRGEIGFGSETVAGDIFSGTRVDALRDLLGTPDGQGTVAMGQIEFLVLSYPILGIQVFAVSSSRRTMFMTVHEPFDGQTPSGAGLGDSRQAFETALSGAGFGGPSSSNLADGVVCYAHSGGRYVGATFTEEGTVNSMTVALPSQACGQ